MRRAQARQRARLAADAGRQGLLHRHRRRGRLARRPGARRHGLHRGDRRRAALSATRASRRSTRAPTASRPSTSSRASCRCRAARRCAAQIAAMRAIVARSLKENTPAFGATAPRLRDAIESLDRATSYLLQGVSSNAQGEALAGATPYLRLFALAQGGAALAEMALAANAQAARRRQRSGPCRPHRALPLLRREHRGRREGPRGDGAWRRGLPAGRNSGTGELIS